MSNFLKIALGVGCGLLLAVGAILFGCTALVGYGASKVEEEKAAKVASVDVAINSFEQDGDWFHIKGTARNTGNAPVTFVKIQVEFLADGGEVRDSDWTYAVDSVALQPGASRTFEVQKRAVPGVSSARARVLAE